MKRIAFTALLILYTVIVVPVFAQQEQTEPPARLLPKEIAEQKTDFIEEQLSLTGKQRKKVYKLYLKQAKAMEKQQTSGMMPQDDDRMQGPPPGGMRGGGSGGRGGGERPPMQGDRQPEMDMRSGASSPDTIEDSEKEIAKREAEMKKILDDDQYGKWIELETESRREERQRQRREEAETLFPKAEKKENAYE